MLLIYERIVRVILLAAVAGLPWVFGGVEPKYHLALAILLLPVLLVTLIRFTRIAAAWRAVAVPLLLIAAAVGLGFFQQTNLSGRLAERISPRAMEVRQEFAAVPGEPESRDPESLSFYCAGTRWATADLIVAAVAFALGAAWFAESGPLWALCSVLALSGGAVAFFGIVQQLSWNGMVYWSIPLTGGGQPFGPFVNRNNAGGFLTLALAAAVGLLVWLVLNVPKLPVNEQLGENLRRRLSPAPSLDDRISVRSAVWFFAHLSAPLVASIVAVALLCGGILASLSRGTAVAMAIGGVTTIALTALASKRIAYVWIIGVAAAGTLALVAWLGEWGDVARRLETLTSRESTAQEPRLSHWTDAWRAVQDSPWLGYGLGNYRFGYTRFERRQAYGIYFHAENQYLEALVVGGAVGLALLLLLILSFARRGWWLLRHARTSSDYGLAAAATAVLTMQAVHAAFDFAWYLPANYFSLALICGALMRRAAAGRSGGMSPDALTYASSATRAFGAVTAVALCSALCWSIIQTRQNYVGDQARRETRILPTEQSTRTLEWVDRAKDVQQAALAIAPDDGDSHVRMAELWIERYRYAFRRQARQDPLLLSLGPSLSVWESPLKLHADAHLLARVDNQPALAAMRNHPLVVENLKPALAEAREARRLFPLSPYPQLLLAQLCFIDESPLDDVFYLDCAERLAIGRDDWMFQIGLLHLDGARPDRAFAAWRRSWELSPRYRTEMLRIAVGYLTPEQLLDQLVPADAETIVSIAGSEMAGADRLYDRRVFCRRALQLLPATSKDATSLYRRGYCQAELGDLADAAATFTEALKATDARVEVYRELAAVQRAQGDPNAAASTMRDAQTFLGEAVEPDGYRRRTLELLAQAAPTPEIHFRRGTVLLERGQSAEAVVALENAVLRDPEHAAWYAELARALEATGKIDAAVRAAETAQSLEPANPHMGSLLARLREVKRRSTPPNLTPH